MRLRGVSVGGAKGRQLGLFALVLCAWCVARDAYAQASVRGPALNWVRLEGAEACDGPVAMAERVEARLEQRVFVRTPDAVVLVEGRVSRTGSGGYGVRVRLSDPAGQVFGERALEVPAGHPCEELDAMAALVIAITLRGDGGGMALPDDVSALLDELFEPAPQDPSDMPEGTASVPPEERAPATSRADDEPSPAAAPAPEPRRLERHGGLAWSLGVSSGLQPRASLGLGLQVRMAWGRWASLLASAAWALPAEEGIGGSEGRLRYHTGAWRASACGPELGGARGQLVPCVRGGPVLITARASGFADQNDTTRALFGEVGPYARARVRLRGPWHLVTALGVPVRIAPPTFRYLQQDGSAATVRQVTRAGVAGEVGVELALW